jgi:hypothetical protein
MFTSVFVWRDLALLAHRFVLGHELQYCQEILDLEFLKKRQSLSSRHWTRPLASHGLSFRSPRSFLRWRLLHQLTRWLQASQIELHPAPLFPAINERDRHSKWGAPHRGPDKDRA